MSHYKGILMKMMTAKIWLFFTSACVLILILGYQLGGRHGLLFAFGLGVFILSLLFFFGENDLLRYTSAKKWGGRGPWGIHDILNEFGSPEIEVYVSESNYCFAYSHSKSFANPAICISIGLLSRLDGQEIRAVIAFLVAMIERQDGFLFSMVSRLAQAILSLGFLLDSFLPRKVIRLISGGSGSVDGVYLWGPFSMLISPLVWFVISMAQPHSTIYKADLGSAQLIKDRYLLALVIWKLDGISKSQAWMSLPGTSHLFFANPDGYQQRNPLFRFHPTCKARIQRLLGYYPL
jgi:Zn-dependent protease with chaperone function